MYKKSKYTIWIKNNPTVQEYLLYNSLSGAAGALNQRVYDYYSNHELFDTEAEADAYLREQTLAMAQNGFLVDSTVDEVATVNIWDSMARFATVPCR